MFGYLFGDIKSKEQQKEDDLWFKEHMDFLRRENKRRIQEEYKKHPKYKFIDDDLNIGELEMVSYSIPLSHSPVYVANYNKVEFNTEAEYDLAYQVAKQYDDLENERIKKEENIKLERERWKEKYRQ